ncbi:MAG: NUDIX domain-containing protein [Halobacteria archaeon]
MVKATARERSAGAVILRRTPEGPVFLLLEYGPGGHWDFVKGKVEPGETEEQTVHRETAEETGIADLRLRKGFRESILYYYRRPNGVTARKTVTYFIGETGTERVVISDEHSKFVWLPLEKALEKVTFDNARRVLKAAAKELGLIQPGR